MNGPMTVGKRDFLLNSNRYLKKVEEQKRELIVTYRNKPVFKITPIGTGEFDQLRGLIKKIDVDGKITDPEFEDFKSW